MTARVTRSFFARFVLFTAALAAACFDERSGNCPAACPSGEACVAGTCRPSTVTDAGDASSSDIPGATDAGDVPPADVSSTDATDASATGQRCSAARPCPAGHVCEEGVCAVDCGASARCGGDRCCAAGEVCYLGACMTPGPACVSGASDAGMCVATGACPTGQQCDVALGRCLPVPTNNACEFRPTGSFDPQLLWEWTGSVASPAYRHVIAAPAVADLDGDGASDVIVPVVDRIPGFPDVGGILCALSGRGDCAGGPRELWCTSPTGPLVNWVASVAVGDLDGTGTLTVVAGDARPDGAGHLVNGITGYDARGNRIPMFGTDAMGRPVDIRLAVGAPAIADLDGDGHAEVIAGFTVFDSRGRLRWQRPGATGNNNFGPITVAVDLDGDGQMEVVGGNMAYHADGTPAWAEGVPARSVPDGWVAVADFDRDGAPEVVAVAQGSVRIFTRTGQLYSTTGATVPGNGGPPTVADLDGDGTPDIAVAGSNSLTAFRVGAGAGHPITTLWQVPSRDFSSNFTGSSVFDFDGDGRAEVIYGDECFARVYDGRGDGMGGTATRFQVPNTSCTGTEYPVVADINGDGKAEFVVVSNDAAGMGTACSPFVDMCVAAFPGYRPTHGVRAYRDRNDNWVATRAIWNQHSYHVTNVCDGRDPVCPPGANRYGATPAREPSSWSFPSSAPLNRYRVNAQIDRTFGAPDLVPRDPRADLSRCGEALGLRVTVANVGAIGVPAGVPVAFYRLTDGAQDGGGRVLLGVARTTRVMLPGGSESVRVDWVNLPPDARGVPLRIEVVVDDDGTGRGAANECDETNNRATLAPTCSDIG